MQQSETVYRVSQRSEQQKHIAMADKSTKFSQYFAAIAAAVGAMAFGTGVAWTSPTGPKLIKGNEYGFEITDEQFSWVGSAMTLGAGCVCILTGYLINFIGRKTTMLLIVIPFTLGWMLIIFPQNIATLIVGRTLLGVASGGICVAAPMYTGEIAEKDIRGMLGSFFQLLITIGILFVYVVGAFVSAFWLSVICASIPLIFGLLVLFCPESPTYLMQKHKINDASEALIWLRGEKYDPTVELTEMQIILDQQQNVSESIVSAMLRRSSVKALSISFGLFVCQQLCGINVVIFYTTDIFKSANTNFSADLSTALVGIVQVIATFLSVIIVDRLGRRLLLLTSQCIVIICTFSLGCYFYMKEGNIDVDYLSWLPVTSVCFFIIAFSLGLGPVPWVMLGELFAPDIKGLAGSISATSNWILAFIVTKTYNNLREAIGVGCTFWLFTSISLLGIFFIYFAVPETKGKSLNSIQQMLDKTGKKNILNDCDNVSRIGEQLVKNENSKPEMIALSNSLKNQPSLS